MIRYLELCLIHASYLFEETVQLVIKLVYRALHMEESLLMVTLLRKDSTHVELSQSHFVAFASR